MSGRFYVITNAEVKGQVVGCLEVVLHVACEIILGPPRKVRRDREVFVVGQSENEAGDWIAGVAGVRILRDRRESRFPAVENVGWRLSASALQRVLVRPPVKPKLKRVTTFCPRDAVSKDQSIWNLETKIVVPDLAVADPVLRSVELHLWECRATRTGNA